MSFAELVLKSNNFEFNGKHYLQKRGTAIGTRMAPSYANIFMDRLERRLIQNAEVKPHIWWRYINDIFIVWMEGEEKLKEFIDYLNNAHDTIKFTCKWLDHEIEFLDVKVLNESAFWRLTCLLSPQTVINIYITVLVIRVHVKKVFHLPRRCDYVEFVQSLVFLKRE